MQLKQYISSRLFADASGIDEAVSSGKNHIRISEKDKYKDWLEHIKIKTGLKELRTPSAITWIDAAPGNIYLSDPFRRDRSGTRISLMTTDHRHFFAIDFDSNGNFVEIRHLELEKGRGWSRSPKSDEGSTDEKIDKLNELIENDEFYGPF